MAKKSMIQRDVKRKRLAKQYANKREQLKAIVMNKELPMNERFEAQLKLSALPRNSAKNRQRNRCGLTGRPRGYYRKFNLSRVALRELGNFGEIPGLTKSSW